MNPNVAIYSAAAPGAHVAGSRMIADSPAALPDRSLGLGPFAVTPARCGLPQIVDAAGQGWGMFANEQLAQATAACLAR